MRLFVTTAHCTSFGHCETCRNKEDGRKFRSDIMAAYEVPGNTVDWECPYGKQWGYKDPASTQPAKPAVTSTASTQPSRPVTKPKSVFNLARQTYTKEAARIQNKSAGCNCHK